MIDRINFTTAGSAMPDQKKLLIEDSPESLSQNLAAVADIGAVPSILSAICERTAMRFAVVARLTDTTWTACAVQDDINFGLVPGGQLDLKTTLCFEAMSAREAVVIDHFAEDPIYCDHHTPRIYGLQSYISVPIILSDGRYFGNLCAIDPQPRQISDARTLSMFEAYAKLIALELEVAVERIANESFLATARNTAELREQFIAVLGHDLRNPLSAVSAISQVITLRGGTPELKNLGERLKRTADRMAALIDDVMDFARGKLGSGIGAEIRPVSDLASALDQVVGELQQANPNVVIQSEISLPGTVHCDRMRTQQLLSNLLGNAISHGASDVPIVVGAKFDGEDVLLSVQNGGDVIRPDSIKKVFEPYWRPGATARGSGLGLGLFICKQIVAAHSGRLEVSSSSTEGTTFTATLPVHGPAA